MAVTGGEQPATRRLATCPGARRGLIWPILVWSRFTSIARTGWRLVPPFATGGWWRNGWPAALHGGDRLRPLQDGVTGDGPGVAVWAAGAMFIPVARPRASGTVSRTHRTFQVAYLILWYAAVNQVAAVDYLGVVLVDGRPAGPPSEVIGGASLAMLATALMVRVARHALR